MFRKVALERAELVTGGVAAVSPVVASDDQILFDY
jgi:hypothetical protein